MPDKCDQCERPGVVAIPDVQELGLKQDHLCVEHANALASLQLRRLSAISYAIALAALNAMAPK